MEEVVAEQTPASDKCARCLQVVSSKAARCPHCGQPTNNPRRLVLMVVAAAGALAMLFMLVVMYRTVYLADVQNAAPMEDDSAPPTAPFAEATSTSQDVPPPPKDDAPAKPAAPDKPPPLNR
jgi:hypothetical protein